MPRQFFSPPPRCRRTFPRRDKETRGPFRFQFQLRISVLSWRPLPTKHNTDVRVAASRVLASNGRVGQLGLGTDGTSAAQLRQCLTAHPLQLQLSADRVCCDAVARSACSNLPCSVSPHFRRLLCSGCRSKAPPAASESSCCRSRSGRAYSNEAPVKDGTDSECCPEGFCQFSWPRRPGPPQAASEGSVAGFLPVPATDSEGSNLVVPCH